MNTNLVVVRPFGGLARGALITDFIEVAAILAGENRLDVVRVNALPEPAPRPSASGGN